MMLHHFERGDVIRHIDGRAAEVRRLAPLRVLARTIDTFSERLVIEQGDPDWTVESRRGPSGCEDYLPWNIPHGRLDYVKRGDPGAGETLILA